MTGSAFLVSDAGLLLTNNHVVASCTSLQASQPGTSPQSAVVLQRDAKNDLALVKIETSGRSVAAFRDSPVRAGEQVIALGFPYRGLLATEVNVSTGTVSALAGIRNDQTKLQIQAPVQPGNSGGPLLDASGAVIGIVVAKLDAMAVANAIGDIPQNINFAIKGEVAISFLRSAGVGIQMSRATSQRLDQADVVARGKVWTYLLECRTGG